MQNVVFQLSKLIHVDYISHSNIPMLEYWIQIRDNHPPWNFELTLRIQVLITQSLSWKRAISSYKILHHHHEYGSVGEGMPKNYRMSFIWQFSLKNIHIVVWHFTQVKGHQPFKIEQNSLMQDKVRQCKTIQTMQDDTDIIHNIDRYVEAGNYSFHQESRPTQNKMHLRIWMKNVFSSVKVFHTKIYHTNTAPLWTFLWWLRLSFVL